MDNEPRNPADKPGHTPEGEREESHEQNSGIREFVFPSVAEAEKYLNETSPRLQELQQEHTRRIIERQISIIEADRIGNLKGKSLFVKISAFFVLGISLFSSIWVLYALPTDIEKPADWFIALIAAGGAISSVVINGLNLSRVNKRIKRENREARSSFSAYTAWSKTAADIQIISNSSRTKDRDTAGSHNYRKEPK